MCSPGVAAVLRVEAKARLRMLGLAVLLLVVVRRAALDKVVVPAAVVAVLAVQAGLVVERVAAAVHQPLRCQAHG